MVIVGGSLIPPRLKADKEIAGHAVLEWLVDEFPSHFEVWHQRVFGTYMNKNIICELASPYRRKIKRLNRNAYVSVAKHIRFRSLF